MNAVSFQAKTERLFLLFAMRETVGDCQAIVDAAITQVQDECKEDADHYDVLLCWYAAALANLRWRQMIAAQGAVSPTYAGSLPKDRDDSGALAFAQRLVREYRGMAARLLRDDVFIFRGI